MKIERAEPNPEIKLVVSATEYDYKAVVNALRASARRSKEAGYVERAGIVLNFAEGIAYCLNLPKRSTTTKE